MMYRATPQKSNAPLPSTETSEIEEPLSTNADQTAQEQVVIVNREGLHVRAASRFVQMASQFEAEIRVRSEQAQANGKSMLELLTLGAAQGHSLVLEAQGVDASGAIDQLASLVRGGFRDSDDTRLAPPPK